MKSGLCEIIVVLDRSGSMEPIKHDMEGGFDTFITDQAKQPGECRVSLYQFDNEYEAVYEGRPASQVPKCSLIPRGSTALVDAVGRTINAVGARFKDLAETERPEKVVFMIITDGHENASREFSTRKVKEMVKHQEDVYQWKFVYLGADAQAFDEAGKIGIMTSAAYVPTSTGTHRLYGAVSQSVSSFRASTSANATLKLPKNIGEDEE